MRMTTDDHPVERTWEVDAFQLEAQVGVGQEGPQAGATAWLTIVMETGHRTVAGCMISAAYPRAERIAEMVVRTLASNGLSQHSRHPLEIDASIGVGDEIRKRCEGLGVTVGISARARCGTVESTFRPLRELQFELT